uniref:Uncharacterized protein n=1 Tax=Myoviridae sp. ctdNl2 TaxID=2825140 RepID=A0A8S5QG30_9CAUD|nr:MAG TPA: hypothetical protein [Myoviridae sp. ctdNl2]
MYGEFGSLFSKYPFYFGDLCCCICVLCILYG